MTPGPNVIMITSSGLNYGIRKSLPHYLGVCIGLPVMVAAVGLGFDVVFHEFPLLHEIIKVTGILYFFYLAYHVATASGTATRDNKTTPFTFIQAAVFQWINPKAWIMATEAIAAYTTDDSDILMQVYYITLAFFIMMFPCTALWLFFGANLKKILKNEMQQRLFNVSMALLLIASITPVIIELALKYFP
ncbi:LysE family translocator [Endozoicomonas lisbonensis]|uniref:LysE family translocator n=1 Tax=Endozoicomonas lisbonensis TaxID=3120522 RepID=UPI0033974478